MPYSLNGVVYDLTATGGHLALVKAARKKAAPDQMPLMQLPAATAKATAKAPRQRSTAKVGATKEKDGKMYRLNENSRWERHYPEGQAPKKRQSKKTATPATPAGEVAPKKRQSKKSDAPVGEVAPKKRQSKKTDAPTTPTTPTVTPTAPPSPSRSAAIAAIKAGNITPQSLQQVGATKDGKISHQHAARLLADGLGLKFNEAKGHLSKLKQELTANGTYELTAHHVGKLMQQWVASEKDNIQNRAKTDTETAKQAIASTVDKAKTNAGALAVRGRNAVADRARADTEKTKRAIASTVDKAKTNAGALAVRGRNALADRARADIGKTKQAIQARAAADKEKVRGLVRRAKARLGKTARQPRYVSLGGVIYEMADGSLVKAGKRQSRLVEGQGALFDVDQYENGKQLSLIPLEQFQSPTAGKPRKRVSGGGRAKIGDVQGEGDTQYRFNENSRWERVEIEQPKQSEPAAAPPEIPEEPPTSVEVTVDESDPRVQALRRLEADPNPTESQQRAIAKLRERLGLSEGQQLAPNTQSPTPDAQDYGLPEGYSVQPGDERFTGTRGRFTVVGSDGPVGGHHTTPGQAVEAFKAARALGEQREQESEDRRNAITQIKEGEITPAILQRAGAGRDGMLGYHGATSLLIDALGVTQDDAKRMIAKLPYDDMTPGGAALYSGAAIAKLISPDAVVQPAPLEEVSSSSYDHSTGGFAEFRRNPGQNGIEVTFKARPPQQMIDRLKSLGFRWSRGQGLWYSKFNADRLSAVRALVENANQLTKASKEYKQAVKGLKSSGKSEASAKAAIAATMRKKLGKKEFQRRAAAGLRRKKRKKLTKTLVSVGGQVYELDGGALVKASSKPRFDFKKGHKSKSGGLTESGRKAYNRATGGNLQAPVTETKPTGKRATRRKSFCARMHGMKRRNTSAKTARDPNSRINQSLRRWKC